jgi:hypothetical protein
VFNLHEICRDLFKVTVEIGRYKLVIELDKCEPEKIVKVPSSVRVSFVEKE